MCVPREQRARTSAFKNASYNITIQKYITKGTEDGRERGGACLFIQMNDVGEKRSRDGNGARDANANAGSKCHEVRRREHSKRFLAVRVNKTANGPPDAASTCFLDDKVPSTASRLVGARIEAIAAADCGVAVWQRNRHVPLVVEPESVDAGDLRDGGKAGGRRRGGSTGGACPAAR
jgi:hypothetical protein